MKANSTWTEEREKLLIDLFTQNKTFGEIGKELGLSRNAIAGKVSRIGLRRKRLTPEEQKEIYLRKLETARKIGYDHLDDLPTLFELPDNGSCRYPVEKLARGWVFCGKPQEPSSLYCPHHVTLCYQKRA